MLIFTPCQANSDDMLTSYPERYMFRTESNGCYLCVGDANEAIHSIESPEKAWTFRTHEGAVTHVLCMGEVHGETPDVVRNSP